MSPLTTDHADNARFRLAVQDRGLEWFSALVMIGWAVALGLPGDTLAAPAFVEFRRFGFTEQFWAAVFGIMGGARIAALYINGRWPRTPYIRMVGSLFGTMSWAQVAWLLFAGGYFATGIPTTGVAVYGLLALADLLSIFRAAFDARYHHP